MYQKRLSCRFFAASMLMSLILLASACSKGSSKHAHVLVRGLNTPVALQVDTTMLFVRDYVLDPSKLEKISFDNALLEAKLTEDKQTIVIVPKDNMPALANLTLHVEGTTHSILLKKSNKKEVSLQFAANKGVQSVQVKGEMNAWNAASSPLKKNGDRYEITFLLSPGAYQYLLVVDGEEMLDPANPIKIDNNIGGFNSLLKVEGPAGDAPVLFSNSFSDGTCNLGFKNMISGVYAYLDNNLLEQGQIKLKKENILIEIPAEAKQAKRSHLRIYAYNENGASNDVLIPLENGKIVDNTAQLDRSDKRAQIIYFLMVDRFMNGDKSNDAPMNDPEVHYLADYHGGDLLGVSQKIQEGYFEELGCNTIWLSPITQNPVGKYGLWPEPRTKFSGYHGYWPISCSEVDFRFGTGENLHELIGQAHGQDMNVILDYVANHVHEEHPLYQQHPDWATDLYLPDGSLNTERWDDHRLTTWFDTFLPTLDFSKEEVVATMTDSALFWLTEYGLDGFRHDATKHIPESFWRELTHKIKSNTSQSTYQVGETYGSRELISSYVSSGMLDGQFDFNLYDDAVACFARDDVSFNRLSQSLKESFKYYGHHSQMCYITGNQDRARFISYAGGEVRFDEDAKAAGWTRDIGVGNDSAYDKLLQLIAFNMTIPGIPSIYYGDEIGMPGGNDPDNRRMMRFEERTNREIEHFEKVKKVVHARKDNLALIYGSFEELEQTKDIWVYTRTYFDQKAIVAFNKGSIEKEYKVPLHEVAQGSNVQATLGTENMLQTDQLIFKLPANSVEIFIIK